MASRPSTMAGSPTRFGAPTIRSRTAMAPAVARARVCGSHRAPPAASARAQAFGPLPAFLEVLAQLPPPPPPPAPGAPSGPAPGPAPGTGPEPDTCCPPFGSSPDSCRARSRRPRRRSWTQALTYSRAPARWSIQSERSCGLPISGAQWRRNCARSPPTRSSSRSPKRRSFSAGTGAGKRGRTSIRRYNWCGCCSHASASGRFRKSSESSPRRP